MNLKLTQGKTALEYNQEIIKIQNLAEKEKRELTDDEKRKVDLLTMQCNFSQLREIGENPYKAVNMRHK